MSHFTPIKTAIKNIQALKIACEEMGLKLEKNGIARGYANNTIKGEYVIKLNGPYDVALQKQSDGTYQIVADWWAGHVAKEIGENGHRLLQQYGVAAAILGVRQARGQSIIKKTRMKDGSIKLTVSVR